MGNNLFKDDIKNIVLQIGKKYQSLSSTIDRYNFIHELDVEIKNIVNSGNAVYDIDVDYIIVKMRKAIAKGSFNADVINFYLTDKFTDKGLDSLDIVELVLLMEEEFNIEIVVDEEELITFDDLLQIIKSKV